MNGPGKSPVQQYRDNCSAGAAEYSRTLPADKVHEMWNQVAAVAGASGVALGAYGAHGLSNKSDKIKQDWKTATQYQLLHALALATLPAFQPTRARTAAGLLFSTGITLFSGSIYAYGLTEKNKIPLAAPTGGIALILGWASMAFLKR